MQNRITGNDGDNILDDGKNNDTLVGGLGNDRYLVRAPGDTIGEQAGEGIDVVLTYRSYALEANVENLFMQMVYTKGGSSAIFNGIGDELDNVIVGTPFANFMIGREGRDRLRGQAGTDHFVFDRAIAPDNMDRIVDFNTNETNDGDKLLMKGSEFGNMAAGALAAIQFATGTSAADANDRFIFDQASGRFLFDADGSGADDQVLIATFDQNALVTASDIEIVWLKTAQTPRGLHGLQLDLGRAASGVVQLVRELLGYRAFCCNENVREWKRVNGYKQEYRFHGGGSRHPYGRFRLFAELPFTCVHSQGPLSLAVPATAQLFAVALQNFAVPRFALYRYDASPDVR